MGLKRKQIVMRQKAAVEQKLKDRLTALAARGLKAPQAGKDTLVRKLKADIKAANRRLARIADLDKRTEEMARTKAEKAAAPKVKEEAGAKSQKPKAAPQEGKAKKPKAPAEGGKSPKKAAASGEGPAAPPKKAEGTAEGPAAPAKAEK